ncbi:MAG TPA: hypothetical protein VFW65_34740 [Pseudonocardiaceae bacterium]|nr:hypothetical protein [Pseudonocardiaceae bacterium]
MIAVVVVLAVLVAGQAVAAVVGWRQVRRLQRRVYAYQRILELDATPPTPPDGGLPGGGQPAEVRHLRLVHAA